MGAVHERTIQSRGDFDYVLKLDGDMVPTSPRSVAILIAEAQRASAARFTTPVSDHFTGRQISGVHVIDPNQVPSDRKVVSHRPDHWIASLPGPTLRRVWNPQVDHAPGADAVQGLRFGLQRGTKARLDGPRSGHWSTLLELAERRLRHPTIGTRAAIFGAYCGLGLHPTIGTVTRSVVDVAGREFGRVRAAWLRDRSANFTPSSVLRWHRALNSDLGEVGRLCARHFVRAGRAWSWPPPRRLRA
jgi:hypothetical protein